jgi:hypothetical protein
MRRLSLAVAAVLGVLLGSLPRSAHADCPNMVGANADLDAIDPATRAQFVRKSLDADASNARLWFWGWAGAGVASATVNGIVAAGGDYGTRVDQIGAASGGLMLAVTTLIFPLAVTSDASAVGTAVDSSANRASADPCAVVAYSERYLAHAAEDEASRKRLVGHALPIGGAIAGGLVLGLGYGHWTSGALNAGIGIVVTELKMLTQPTGAVRALDRYRTGVLGKDGPAVGWQLVPMATPQGGGLALTMVY